jgi:hypothetical protein
METYPLLEKYASISGRFKSLRKSLAKITNPNEYSGRVRSAINNADNTFGREAAVAVKAGNYTDRYPQLMKRARLREERLAKFKSKLSPFVTPRPQQTLAGAY